jgi:seryl-tRNA synthetase
MLDIKFVLNNLDTVKTAFKNRGGNVSIEGVEKLNEQRKSLQKEYDELRAKQNQVSKDIPQLKKQGQDVAALMAEMQKVSQRLKEIAQVQADVDNQLAGLLLVLPNIPHASVPVGSSAEHNQEVRAWGTKRAFDFTPLDHVALGEKLGLLDFERAAKISGARFAITRGALARLERALISFMIDVHVRDHGYEEVLPPFLVNADTLMGTGQLPKFEEDLFKTTLGLYLIPTAEVPVTNIYRGETLNAADLPKKFCSYTPCFRSEAGSYGKDVKGLIRQHQFNKVELVKLTHPDRSYDELESLTQNAERILQLLNIPYRTVVLCTGDMGFGSAKTYDIEVWLPSQNAYREISSCSNCTDFQARRMNTRFKDADGKLKYVHTLNGSGLAVGRTLIAILENYQQKDGSIEIPEVLRPYMCAEIIRQK